MQTKNIMIAGVGGQGTLLASRILGNLMLESGYDVKISEVHGMAQRGGSVVTFVRYGTCVFEPIVEEGQADILIAFEQLEALRYEHYLKKAGIIVLNNQCIQPMPVIMGDISYPEGIIDTLGENHLVYHLDAEREAKILGNIKASNTIMLGAAAHHMEFTNESWIEAIRKCLPPKYIELNIHAFLHGYSMKTEQTCIL